MNITISRESLTPVYKQIYETLKTQIIDGTLIEGYKLPSERKLAQQLAVNRSTIVNAYNLLRADGLILSSIGQGTIVAGTTITPPSSSEPYWPQIFASYAAPKKSLIKNYLRYLTQKDLLSFAPGTALLSPDSQSRLGTFIQSSTTLSTFPLFSLTPDLSLSVHIQELMHQANVECTMDEIMILSGAQQGLDLLARTLISPGDYVVVEAPSYFPAVQCFKNEGAKILEVPIDTEGMCTSQLEDLVKHYKPKLVYTMPTFQNPSGVQLSLERRKQLNYLAHTYNFLIIEDDVYGFLRYEGSPLPIIKSMDYSGHVIYLNSFSKSFYSGLKIGYMVAHKEVIKHYKLFSHLAALEPNTFSSHLLATALSTHYYQEHLKNLCLDYKKRRDTMLMALSKYAPPSLTWQKPDGGYYIWCKIEVPINLLDLLKEAATQHIAFMPGDLFFYTRQDTSYIRLNFTAVPCSQIEQGIQRLCAALTLCLSSSATKK